MPRVTAYLALGANVGDRSANIDAGLARLRSVPGVAVEAVSPLHESAAVGPPQPPFLNGAARVRTVLDAGALLAVCKAIEGDLGRVPGGPRNRPRPLDLDLLLYGDEVIDTKQLQVPHPRMFEREFVLRPLRELGVDLDRVPRLVRPHVTRDGPEFARVCTRWLQGGCTVGLVPTMGALHAGHASLVAQARAECDRVAVSIFVNPLQFAPHEDLAVYPRPFAADLELLRGEGADAVFAPSVEAMYGEGFASRVAVGAEAEGMEGALRPGHFSGVATVVAKLFVLARPTHAYFGEKDAQQLEVIERLVRDLGFPLVVRRCATVRESDGLALSSRNTYLSAADRAAAPVLFQALTAARRAAAAGERDARTLARLGAAVVAREPRATLDYFEIRGGRAYVAARFGAEGQRRTRLIDNLQLDAGVEGELHRDRPAGAR